MKKLLLFISVLSLCLSSCKDEIDAAFDRKSYDRNKKKWEQLNIKDYSYEYTVGCMCDFPRPPGIIVVRDGKIQELIPWNSDYAESNYERYMTIDCLFKEIESVVNEIKDKNSDRYGCEIQVEYDEKYFYPKSFYITMKYVLDGPNRFIDITRFEKE